MIKKTIALLLAVCITAGLCCFTVAGAGTGSDAARYTKKIVSVLYDNSGSMRDDKRYNYAKYAAQTLMAVVDERDTLYIVPMNRNGLKTDGLQVDLTGDREQAITSALNTGIFSPNGGTPGESVGTAVRQLVNAGMKKSSEVVGAGQQDAEYWLIVLTDGEFSGGNAADLVDKYATGYNGLHTIYIGFGPSAADLSGNTYLKNKMPFTAYKVNSSDKIIESMREIACQFGGRCQVEKQYISVNGSTVTVDLSAYGFSVSSISAIVQNCGATLLDASYNGKSMGITQKTVLKPDDVLGIKNGYSAVIKNNTDGYFNGSTLTLTYSGVIDADDIAVMIEPALGITPYLEYYDGSSWTEVNAQYVNEKLKPGSTVRVGYRVSERMNGTQVDLARVFGQVEEKATYAGNSIQINKQFALVEGKNEIALEVSVLEGKFKMYGSIFCNVEKDPSDFRIESKVVNAPDGNITQAKVEYTVFIDGKECTPDEIRNKGFEWNATAADNAGNDVPVTVTVNGGKLGAIIDCGTDGTRQYTVTMTVQNSDKLRSNTTQVTAPELIVSSNVIKGVDGNDDKFRIEYTITANGTEISGSGLNSYNWFVTATSPEGKDYPVNKAFSGGKCTAVIDTGNGRCGTYKINFSLALPGGELTDTTRVSKLSNSVTVALLKNDCTSLTQHQLEVNDKEIVFELTAEGMPLDFEGNMRYTLTVDGKNATGFAKAEGNRLIYVPKAEHFNGAVANGAKNVELNVAYIEKPEITASGQTEINITDTVYAFEALNTANKAINRFDVPGSNASLAFRLVRDGNALGKDELQQLFDDGSITVRDEHGIFGWQFWLPAGWNVTVEDMEGQGVIVCNVVKDFPAFLLMPMFLMDKDHPVTVTYAAVGATGTDAFTAPTSPFIEYLWRIVLFIIIVYLILFGIGFFKCKSFRPGAVVEISCGGANTSCTVYPINAADEKAEKWKWHFTYRLWHPNKLFGNQPLVTCNMVSVAFIKNRQRMVFNTNRAYRITGIENDDDISITALKGKVRRYLNDSTSVPTFRYDTDEFRLLLGDPVERGEVPDGTDRALDGTYYAMSNNGSVNKIIFYIS